MTLRSDDGWEDYESGPFCRHWGDPADCPEECQCAHTCTWHEWDEPGACLADGCDCEEWQEVTP